MTSVLSSISLYIAGSAASRLAALLLCHTCPICFLVAPGQSGASPPADAQGCQTQDTRAPLLFIAIMVALVSMTLQAAERTPEGLYSAALARERGLREPGVSPSLNDLRGAIASYESIARRFPSTTYTDHALWQAAGLAVEAYDHHRQRQDLETGLRLLHRLQETHPDSPFASRVRERRNQLRAISQVVLLTAIDRETRPDAVRVTLQLDHEVAFRSERLENPDRLFFDFPGTEAATPLRNATLRFAGTRSAISSIRLGRHPGQTTRVVVDTVDVHACRVFTLYDPYRVVIDCDHPHGREAVGAALQAAQIPPETLPTSPRIPSSPVPRQLVRFDAEQRLSERLDSLPSAHMVGRASSSYSSSLAPQASRMLRRVIDPRPLPPVPPRIRTPPRTPPPPPAVRSEPAAPDEFSLARQLGLQVSRIVIDPGHGGHDPGARSHGLQEADVVLDIAHKLERLLLTQPGIEVVLTRRGNSYLPLEARTTLANRVDADLFLSIHANASRNTAARGVETYFLNFAPNPQAERLAARENVSGAGTMNDLATLLQAIAGNSKIDESRAFADKVQVSLVSRLRRHDPDIPNLGVKQAPFIVLIGARMPSILAEISFLTNPHDATLLSTGEYREDVAEALFEGILRYQRSLDRALRLAKQNR